MTNTDVQHQSQFTQLLQNCEQDMLHRIASNQPSCFHLASGGSRTRAKLCIQAGLALKLPAKTIVALASSIELLHNASLVHDDLQDADETRRGRASVWKKFGKAQAICAGDLMLSAAFGALANTESQHILPALLTRTQQAVSLTVQGQSRDLEVQSSITEHEYEQIAALKSGPLIQLVLALPLIAAGLEEHIETVNQALSKFSIAYQIVDDLDDWQQDLLNNQLNLVNLLASKRTTEEALEIARKRAQNLAKMCQRELESLPSNCAAEVITAAHNLIVKANGGQHE